MSYEYVTHWTPVLYGWNWKEIQGEIHPIPTTLKFAPESLMEIKLHRYLTNKYSTKECPCTREEDFCYDMAQCLRCKNRPAEPALYKADDNQSEDESEKELHDDSRDKEIY